MTTPKPLPAKPIIRRGPPPTFDWYGTANTLRAKPGIWHEIRVTERRTNDPQRIKTGANPAFRDGRWDAMDEQAPDGFVLYACYEPEEGPGDD